MGAWMTVCKDCGVAVDDGVQRCRACCYAKAVKTWQRQIRVYGVVVLIGIALFGFAIMQIRSSGSEQISPLLRILSVAGGLATLGGLFGLALAIFFQLWHKKRDH